MTRPKRAPVGGAFFDLDDAERAAPALRAKRVAVEIQEVTCVICPGAIRKIGRMLYVARDEVRKARGILDQAGFSRFLRPGGSNTRTP